MKKEVPYFKQPDDTHCFQACLKMVLKYFFPEKDFTYEELDKISDKPKDKWTWCCAAAIQIKKMGLKIKIYSNFDYNEFTKTGANYIRKKYDKEIAEETIEMSDIESEIENAKKMIKENIFELKELLFEDIEKTFKDYVIILLINSRTINSKPGYAGHFVVLTGFDENNVYVHDPGINDGSANRKIEKDLFKKAWEYQKFITLIKK
ncbi:MAG: hypothetical protein GTN40_03165 [Candidatus Aenigmarchaeota archaeon]|nr:hypothetical protein [Candidatus Aenigmarchaeota archaeon]